MQVRDSGHVRIRLVRALTTLVAVLLATVGLAAPSAVHAEVQHPRQQWMRESTAGLFLHWGMFTAPVHTDCGEWEQAVTDGGWTPGYWIEEAQKLGASYIVLASFHSRLGYARPWPSQIPGSCSTKRDFLGELVAAGKEAGVKVLLYMTDDPQWHNEKDIETLDSTAYSAYKGKDIDLTTRQGFGEFSYDNFFEVMKNYPDLAGFWIDNDNEYWEKNHLYEQIRELRPSWLLSNNNEDTPIMDTVSNEQKTGMKPAYDYPQATFTPMPRLTEADYKLPTTGDWWYDGRQHPVDYDLSVGRYVANAGSSIKSLMAETAMVNGKFPPEQAAFNDFMSTWVPPIRESLYGTQGGGYMYGGMQPGFWNDGAHGVITVKDDARTQYVHVITPPASQDFVRLRDNGYKVTAVTDLRTGKPFRFAQSGGRLTILGVEDWDDYDTVFEVLTSGQQLLYNQSQVSSTASAQRAGHGGDNLTDGDYTTFWDSNATLPVSVTVDLGEQQPASFLTINQREWSPTHARSTFGRPEDSARIKEYEISVSTDGQHWGQPVRTGILPSRRGVQVIDFERHDARYVRLTVLSTWAGPQAPNFYRQLKIDEIRVGHGYPSTRQETLPGEAEARTNDLIGNAHTQRCAACSGGAMVTGLGQGPGNAVTINDVRAPEAGDYRLDVHYASTVDTDVVISVNGGPAVTAAAPAEDGVVETTSIPVSLNAGSNTIALWSSRLDGPGIDRVAVRDLPPNTYQPQTALQVQPERTYVGNGAQSVEVTAEFRLDDEDPIQNVVLQPSVPDGWTVAGEQVTAARLEHGQSVRGEWTVTTPADTAPGTTGDVTVHATFDDLGRTYSEDAAAHIAALPADRVFMREAESFENTLSGNAGRTGCGACSGDQKVRNIGGSPASFIQFDDVLIDHAGTHTLYLDYTLNGTRSFFVSVNGGPGIEVSLTDDNTGVDRGLVDIMLNAGANTIKIYNDESSAPDLDLIGIGLAAG